MKRKHKIILGIFGLILFATLLTIIIIKKNESEAHKEDETANEEITEMASAEESSVEEKPLMFPDTREYTDEELEMMDGFEPEGDDHYEVDEEGPMYHVFINNYEEIYTHYDDFKICNELPYYLHTYFNLCTGNLDEMYEVTITEGSCKTSEYDSLVTFEATVDKYPDMIIYIEYDKNYREFGIKSVLGDYSLDALKTKGSKSGLNIEYDPSLDEGVEDTSASDTVAVEAD